MAIQTSLPSDENSYDSDLYFRRHALGKVFGLDGREAYPSQSGRHPRHPSHRSDLPSFSCGTSRVIYDLSSLSWPLPYPCFPAPGCTAASRKRFLTSRFRILPAGLLGSSLTATYSLGTLKGDRRDFRKDFNSSGIIG
jgi:hypothetical protein